MATRLITQANELREVASRLEREERVALDIESNGLFAYRARLCILQLATRTEVFVVDALATPLDTLRPLLASSSTAKLVHDVSFDARILAETHVVLANVLDTSLAARMLGRTATGLAS